MRNLVVAFVLFFGSVASAWAEAPSQMTSLRAIGAISNAEATRHETVAFEATVIYFRWYENTMFVQDGDAAIFVLATTNARPVPGDRILVRGTTHESFRPYVTSNDITILRHGSLPKPVPASFAQMIHSELDCRLVTFHAVVRAADMVLSSNKPSSKLQLLADGGNLDAVVDNEDADALKNMLDAEVEITGAVSARFDGKMQEIGVLLHVASLADVKVIKHASVSPWSLPLTPMDEIIRSSRLKDLTQRVHVQGTITYFHPGDVLVLQNGSKSLWVMSQTRDDLHIGDVADVIGFPVVHDGFLALERGEVQNSHVQAPIAPVPATWHSLSSSRNIFDLVSIEGQVVLEVREATQDEYVLTAEGQLFSAIIRHPPSVSLTPVAPPPMKEIAPGSKVRITGVCIPEDSNPFNTQVPFNILMRSFDDIAVVAKPPWLNVRNLIVVVSGLLIVVIGVGAWGALLNRKVRRQTSALSERVAAEAVLERQMAQLEQRRSRILEKINGSTPLAEILEDIAEMTSFRLDGAPCWCEIVDGARRSLAPSDRSSLRIARIEILSRAGAPLGSLFVGMAAGSEPAPSEVEALSVGARLATLAIETRRLYADLLHRSEFDLLTDIHNRFSLDKQLSSRIEGAHQSGSSFGLIYIDLDEFKQVNDLCGHFIGDLYLQDVTRRMMRQLRSTDMLARLGGDEFAVISSNVQNRAEVEEIALRLERCFDDPFAVEGHVLHGSASVGVALYPQDATTKDTLLNAADAAMYISKNKKRQRREIAEDAKHGKVILKGNS
jgi:diguanylate cyclase (GGDEF)-like protein